MEPVLHDEREAAGLAVLERLAVQEAAVFTAQAEQLHDSAVLSGQLQGAGADRVLLLDVAATLRIGQGAAAYRLAEASRLVEDLPHTLAGLRTGAVLLGQARQILKHAHSCSPTVAAWVDRRLAALAAADPTGLAGWTARRLGDRLSRLVLRAEAELEPKATARRESTARTGRRVSVRPEPDGMGSLWALLPAAQLRTFTLGLDEMHRRQLLLDRAYGIDRTADQRRADLLAMLPALALHALDSTTPTVAPDGSCRHPAVIVNVHVPMATALGLSQEPGVLDGYGPISATHTRLLLPDATLGRVWVDQATGQPLGADPTTTAATAITATPNRAARRATAGAAREGTPGRATPQGSSSATPADAAQVDAVQGLVPGDAVPGDAVPGDAPLADAPLPDAGRADATPVDVVPSDALARARVAALLSDQPVLIRDHPEPRHDASPALAEFLRLRDPLCTGPSCSTSSRRSDLDHETPWPQGPTTAGNLRPRSRRCHRAKTFTWTVHRHGDGSHTRTSPTGRSYPVPPYWDAPPTPHLTRTQNPHPGLPAELDDDSSPSTLIADLDELEVLRGARTATPAPTPEPGGANLIDDEPPPF